MLPLEGKLSFRTVAFCAVYISWCVGISAYSLGSVAEILRPFLAVRYGYFEEAMAVGGQVAFQWGFMLRASWDERLRYMFVAFTVSMMGSLLLLPLVLYHRAVGVSELTALAYFFAVVGIIFVVHHRLIVGNGFPRILSATWVLYRVFLLGAVLIPR